MRKSTFATSSRRIGDVRGHSRFSTDADKPEVREKSTDKKAYVPVIKRKHGDQISKMQPMERLNREMFLLHDHPNALEVIQKGIKKDQ